MQRNFVRLFEPATLEDGVPNPRHLSNVAYLSLARAAALRVARRNGVAVHRVEVEFRTPGFAPTRVTVALRHETKVRPSSDREDRVAVRARATAEIAPESGDAWMPGQASAGLFRATCVQSGQADAPGRRTRVRPHG